MLNPKLNLKGIGDYLNERTMHDAVSSFPYGGLWLYCGLQGSGKTLLMMHHVKAIHEEYPEALIVSDISLFGIPCLPYKGVDMLTDGGLNNGSKGIIFIFDEIQTLFSSLESSSMPLSLVSTWSQNRKNRRLILGTSQRFNRCAKPIREQTTWLYHCSSRFWAFHFYRVYDGQFFDESGKYTDKTPKLHWYVPQVNVMRCYNTLEVVRRSSYEREA